MYSAGDTAETKSREYSPPFIIFTISEPFDDVDTEETYYFGGVPVL